jgi:hypothetical protein
MNVMKRALLILPVSAVLLLSLAGTRVSAARVPVGGHGVATVPDSESTTTCDQGPYNHYYGAAFSGTGSHGTAANIWTWSNWSVDSSGQNLSLEAVGLNDPSAVQYSLEAGFYSGWINDARNGHSLWYTNGMTPYYATANGTDGYVQQGTYLPANTYIGIAAFFYGATDYAIVTGPNGSPIYMDQAPGGSITYQDQANLTNEAWGEVSDTNTWMGGGSGDSMTLFWVDYKGSQHPWGHLSYCDNPPFWASSSNNTDYFANGGY